MGRLVQGHALRCPLGSSTRVKSLLIPAPRSEFFCTCEVLVSDHSPCRPRSESFLELIKKSTASPGLLEVLSQEGWVGLVPQGASQGKGGTLQASSPPLPPAENPAKILKTNHQGAHCPLLPTAGHPPGDRSKARWCLLCPAPPKSSIECYPGVMRTFACAQDVGADPWGTDQCPCKRALRPVRTRGAGTWQHGDPGSPASGMARDGRTV